MSQDYAPPGNDQYRPSGKSKNNTTLIIVLIVVICLGGCCFCGLPALLLPAVQSAREAARNMQCQNNMKQIGLALHNYHSFYNTLPPAYTVDDDGKPLHSWRVMLLPLLEQDHLYSQIKLDEPWDSPYNRQFHDQMPSVYSCPSANSSHDGGGGMTSYKWVLGPDTISDGPSARNFGDFQNGTSNSIAAVEVIPSTNWMDPSEIMESELDFGVNISKTDGVGSNHQNGFGILYMDGRVERVMDESGPNLRQRCQIRPHSHDGE